MTRYMEMFGTPEDAARTLLEYNVVVDFISCSECKKASMECFKSDGVCAMESMEAIAEWLTEEK